MIDPEIARSIRLVGFDVDGVMTDAGAYIGAANGQPVELKRYDIQDGVGIALMQRVGIKAAIVTGRVSESVRIRARELGIDDRAAILEHSGQGPISEGNLPIIAAALRGHAAGFLLAAINPVWKTGIRVHVVELCGRLVVPTAPGCPVIHADGRALIRGNCNRLGIFRADPNALIVVPAGSALPPHKGFSREVLLVAGLLADEHQFSASRAFAEHGLRGVLPQRAGAAVVGLRP